MAAAVAAFSAASARSSSFLRRSSCAGRGFFCACSDRIAGVRNAKAATSIRMRKRMMFTGPTPGWVSHSSVRGVWCHDWEVRAVPEGIPAERASAADYEVRSSIEKTCLLHQCRSHGFLKGQRRPGNEFVELVRTWGAGVLRPYEERGMTKAS